MGLQAGRFLFDREVFMRSTVLALVSSLTLAAALSAAWVSPRASGTATFRVVGVGDCQDQGDCFLTAPGPNHFSRILVASAGERLVVICPGVKMGGSSGLVTACFDAAAEHRPMLLRGRIVRVQDAGDPTVFVTFLVAETVESDSNRSGRGGHR